MKTVLRSLFSVLCFLACVPLSAQNVGDLIIHERISTTGRVQARFWPKGALTLWGTDSSSLPAKIALGSGLTLSGSPLTLSASGGGGGTWGSITGTLSAQTDLNTALGLKAPLASPTFFGTVTIPAGASISGYATTASLEDYLPILSAADAQLNSLLALEALAAPHVGVSNGGTYSSNLWPEQLDFEDSATGFSVTVVPPTTGTLAANALVTLPSATGTLLTTASTLNGGNLSAGSVANAKLANSSITINGSPISLGGSVSVSAGYPLTLTGGTVTTSSPLLSGTQTWNAGAQVFHAADISITSTNGSTHAAGSTLQRWLIGGSPVLSIASNTTSGNEASSWRLVFGAESSLGYSASWGALMVRNAANTAYGNLRAQVIQGTGGLYGTNYIAIGSGTEGDVELSSSSWRTAGVRLRDTASIVWTSTSTAAGPDRNFTRSGAGSPEGIITANVGSMWLRTDGGTGSTLYIKESGTGNTGWVAK